MTASNFINWLQALWGKTKPVAVEPHQTASSGKQKSEECPKIRGGECQMEGLAPFLCDVIHNTRKRLEGLTIEEIPTELHELLEKVKATFQERLCEVEKIECINRRRESLSSVLDTLNKVMEHIISATIFALFTAPAARKNIETLKNLGMTSASADLEKTIDQIFAGYLALIRGAAFEESLNEGEVSDTVNRLTMRLHELTGTASAN